MVRGHLSPRFLDLKTYRMGVIGPRDNVLPGPAVALDGPTVVLPRHICVDRVHDAVMDAVIVAQLLA